MGAVTMDPGALNLALTLQAPAGVSDGQGGRSEAWADAASVFARVEPVAAKGVFAAGQALAEVTHRITIRARPDVASGMRFSRGGRTFGIVAIHDPDETGRYLVCMAKEAGR